MLMEVVVGSNLHINGMVYSLKLTGSHTNVPVTFICNILDTFFLKKSTLYFAKVNEIQQNHNPIYT